MTTLWLVVGALLAIVGGLLVWLSLGTLVMDWVERRRSSHRSERRPEAPERRSV